MEPSSSEYSRVVRALPGTAAFAAAAVSAPTPPPDRAMASGEHSDLGSSPNLRAGPSPSTGVELVTPGRTGSAEPGALIRGRLSAATAIMLVATAIFYFRGFSIEYAPVRLVHLAVVLSLGICLIVLRLVKLSTAQLRRLELAIFGGIAAYLALYQYELVSHRMLHFLERQVEANFQSAQPAKSNAEAFERHERARAESARARAMAFWSRIWRSSARVTSSDEGTLHVRGSAPVSRPSPAASAPAAIQQTSSSSGPEGPRDELLKVPAIVGSTVMYATTLMLIYGMLIPNTWRRAAAMVIPIGLSTIAVPCGLTLQFPDMADLTFSPYGWEQMSNDVIMLAIGAGLAIYGTHLIHSLRIEAHEARRMGQYTLGERLGTGGMGEVYLAEHRLMKRPCALKLIRPERARDVRALARFEREVRAMARLSHWNTVEVYDYGRAEDGTFYYVMEYLRGPSLNELVRRHGPLPPGRVIYLLRQACDALAEAHVAGLVHRDLKPANIIVAECGGRFDVVKLLDFGLVTPLAEEPPPDVETTLDGIVTGSPLYMSPEQATGDRRPDGRSDLYSLGAVGYFLLTGKPPFEGPTAMSVMMAHARDPVIPPSKLRADAPRDLEAILLHCMAKEPADRYADADSLNRAFSRCQHANAWDTQKAALWWKELRKAGDASGQSAVTYKRGQI
jgi:serine/threonine-protein kinase